MNKALLATCILTTFITTAPNAADAYSANQDPSTDEKLQACNAIRNQTERLNCLRRVLDEMDRAIRDDVPVIENDRRRQREAADDDYDEDEDVSTPDSEDDFGRRKTISERNQEVERSKVVSRIINASYTPNGRLVIELENGQKWESNSAARMFQFDPEERPMAEIKKSGFGGFRLKIDGTAGFLRVTRIDQ